MVRLKFSPNHDTPSHKHFIQLEKDPIIETASFADIDTMGKREMDKRWAKSTGRRHYFIFFEVMYRVYKGMDDGSLLLVEGTRRERAEFLLSSREQHWGFYTDKDRQVLFQSLALLTIPPIPSVPFSSPYRPTVE